MQQIMTWVQLNWNEEYGPCWPWFCATPSVLAAIRWAYAGACSEYYVRFIHVQKLHENGSLVCKRLVGLREKSLHYGVCDRWFHLACFSLNQVEFNLIQPLTSKLLMFVPSFHRQKLWNIFGGCLLWGKICDTFYLEPDVIRWFGSNDGLAGNTQHSVVQYPW